MIEEEKDAPPGWSYNPSSWKQRLPLVAVAMCGFGIAFYLALYQWRVIPDVWEPFFGSGSKVILNSFISRLLPIPDAALRQRSGIWRTRSPASSAEHAGGGRCRGSCSCSVSRSGRSGL